ncbi:MAG TPA: glycosyltransferase, partial [Pirellulales bacterium]
MTHYSAIVPQQNRAEEVRRQLPALMETLSSLGQAFEIIVVDDGSSLPNLRQLDQLLGQWTSLRLVRLDRPSGVSVALAAGIQAARGEVIFAIEAGEHYPASQLVHLAGWLDRADLVVGRRRRFGWSKFYQRVTRLPRALLLGLDSHDPDCLFWAARREVLVELTLMPGMARYL